MTESGPVLANIALDGIHSDSVTTREDYEFFTRIYQSIPVRFEPILAGNTPSATERVKMQFHNPADLPMRVRLKPGFSFDYLSELPVDTSPYRQTTWLILNGTFAREAERLPLQEVFP
jgi:hypothetical protein